MRSTGPRSGQDVPRSVGRPVGRLPEQGIGRQSRKSGIREVWSPSRVGPVAGPGHRWGTRARRVVSAAVQMARP